MAIIPARDFEEDRNSGHYSDGPNPFRYMFDYVLGKNKQKQIAAKASNAVGEPSNDLAGFFPGNADFTFHQPLAIHGDTIGKGGLPSDFANQVDTYAKAVSPQYVFRNQQKVRRWKRLASTGEVNDILNKTCDEVVSVRRGNQICYLTVSDDFTDLIGPAAKEFIVKEWKYYLNNIVMFNKNAWKWTWDLLTEGRLFVEKVYDRDERRLVGVQKLPSFNMTIIENKGEIIAFHQATDLYVTGYGPSSGYTRKGQNGGITFGANQIMFADFGMYGPGGINDPECFLSPAVKVANQLDNIETAIVNYRIQRGHEKRVYKIDVSRIPQQLQKQYMQQMAFKLNRKVLINKFTGEIVGPEDTIGLSEDIFIPISEDNSRTDITTLAAGSNLGEIADLNYFLNKLYMALRNPQARLHNKDSMNFNVGKSGEMLLEETFRALFIKRVQNTISDMLIDGFITHLETIDYLSDEVKDASIYNVEFNQYNSFEAFRESEIWALKFSQMATVKDQIWTPENPTGFLSPDYVMKKVGFTEEEIAVNRKMLKEYKASILKDNVLAAEVLKKAMDDKVSGNAPAPVLGITPTPELAEAPPVPTTFSDVIAMGGQQPAQITGQTSSDFSTELVAPAIPLQQVV